MPEMHLNRPNLRWLQSHHQAKGDEKAWILPATLIILVHQFIVIITHAITAAGHQLQRRRGGEPVH